MAQTFRVITWNCRRASLTSGLWDFLVELDPDVALLQDFGTIPDRVLDTYSHLANGRVSGSDRAPRYMTGILVKGQCDGDIPLSSPTQWVARELENFGEFFTAKAVTLNSGINLKLLSVYSPAIPIDRERLVGIDTVGVQLTQNSDVWLTELMWAALKALDIPVDEPFIVAGDLNSSETFDYLWRGGPRGNREIIERMNALRFYDCLRMFKGKLVPTFRTPRGGYITHQLDHLYVTPMLLSRLMHCDVGDAQRIFEPRPMLSDHLPIIADFTWPD